MYSPWGTVHGDTVQKPMPALGIHFCQYFTLSNGKNDTRSLGFEVSHSQRTETFGTGNDLRDLYFLFLIYCKDTETKER